MSRQREVSPEELAAAKKRCAHGMPAIVYCSSCADEEAKARSGRGPRNALGDAHKCLFAAVQFLEEAGRLTTDEFPDAIADVAEELRVQNESLEAVFGALVLRGGGE